MSKGTSSFRAFVSFEFPGSSPTIRPVVLPETELTIFAPGWSMAYAVVLFVRSETSAPCGRSS